MNSRFLILTGVIIFILLISCEKKEVDDPTKGLPVVTTMDVTQVTNNTAISGGQIVSQGTHPITQKGVCWSTTPLPTTLDGITIDGSGIEDFSSSLSRLNSSTTYYLRAYATNSRGTSYGEEKVFTTFYGMIADFDGNTYGTVMVGDKEWLGQNLRTTKYRNGNEIPTGLGNVNWQTTAEGAYSIYPNSNVAGISSDEEMLIAYGALYNGYAVVDPRGLCPSGWRVPSDADWDLLSNYLIETYANVTANNIGNAIKSSRQVNSPLGDYFAVTTHPRWTSSESNHGTNVVNFSALPGGTRQTSGSYSFIGNYGLFWSTTPGIDGFAYRRQIFYDSGEFSSASLNMRSGFSVRCIKN